MDFTKKEIEQFKQDWGQTHSEVCANLGYDEEDADDPLMIDFFWYPKDQLWLNKESSMFTEREQEIADYLRNSN